MYKFNAWYDGNDGGNVRDTKVSGHVKMLAVRLSVLPMREVVLSQ